MSENKNVNSKQDLNGNNATGHSKALWLAILFLIVVLFILLGVIAGGVYWYIHNKNLDNNSKDEIIKSLLEERKENSLNKSEASEDRVTMAKKEKEENATTKDLMYENKEYGFRLKLTPSWADYKVKEVFQGGDFNVADVDFYLPSQELDGNSDIPGYTKMFSISVYVTESWQEAGGEQSNGDTVYEVLGSNDFYTFVYSHLNGLNVTDISSQAIKDMDTIAHSIKLFDSQSVAHDDADLSKSNAVNTDIEYDDIYSNRFKFDENFAKNSIEYWNCKFNYQLNYPSAWSNNGMTNMSQKVVLYGKGVTATIKAVEAKGLTIKEFFVREYKKEFPKAVLEPEGDRFFMSETNTLTYYLAFAAPYEWRLYWRVADSDMGIVLTVKGKGFIKEWDNITKMFGTLRVNTTPRPECAS